MISVAKSRFAFDFVFSVALWLVFFLILSTFNCSAHSVASERRFADIRLYFI